MERLLLYCGIVQVKTQETDQIWHILTLHTLYGAKKRGKGHLAKVWSPVDLFHVIRHCMDSFEVVNLSLRNNFNIPTKAFNLVELALKEPNRLNCLLHFGKAHTGKSTHGEKQTQGKANTDEKQTQGEKAHTGEIFFQMKLVIVIVMWLDGETTRMNIV